MDQLVSEGRQATVMAKYEDEPTPRFWHHAFLHDERVYVRGGQTDDFESERDALETTLKHFDPVHERWQGIKTEGIPHPGLTQIACVSAGGILYLYGTHERKVLSQLNLRTLVWSQLWDTLEKDDGKTPMIKATAGMVPFSGGHLALFAGYACRLSGPLQPGSEWMPNPYEKIKGWTNEFHLFNICKRMWVTPTFKGTRPPPCSDFSLNGVTLNRAVLFGGYQHNLSQEELYIIDFDMLNMEIEFTKIKQQKVWPPGRECHMACCLGLGTKHPQLLISGGKNFRDIPLNFDLWMLDLTTFVWKKVKLPAGKRSPRWGHSMTTVVHEASPELETVVIFGGSPGEFTGSWRSPGFPKLTETTIYSFGNHGQEWVLLDEQTCGKSSFRAVLEWETFEFNYLLSMKAIFLLEKRYGVPLLSEIAKKQEAFQREIHDQGPQKQKGILPSISRWLRSDSEIKPTWESLFRVLHNIDLGPLAWQMVDCLLKAMIDTANELESELFTHYDAVLEDEDILRHKIESFVAHSNATIERLYDQLRLELIDKLHPTSSAVAEVECRAESTSSATGKHTESTVKIEPKKEEKVEIKPIKAEPADEVDIKPAKLTSSIERNGKHEYPMWMDPSELKIQQLKKENQVLRSRLEKLEWQLTEQFTSPQPIVRDFQLQGVEMCGQTTFVVTDYAEQFVWERYGLKLRIPENSLPKGVGKCTVSIGASIAGQYQFPENFHLVSAVFWFRCEPFCKFTKSITMEMEHCAKLKKNSKLSFMRAKCTQERLPYTFKKIGGCFASDCHFGSIELNGFSGLGVVQEESQNKHQDSSPCPEREYGARLYHHCTHKNVIRYNIDFVVTWNTSAHLTAIEQVYERVHAQRGFEQVVEIESNRIELDIPDDGITTQDGWNISPLGPPVILKRNVDSYDLGKIIPKCQFSANISLQNDDSIPPLQHKVKLIGTKSPYNYLTFNIDPDLPRSEQHSLERSISEPGSASAPPPKRRKLSEPAQKYLLDEQTEASSSSYNIEATCIEPVNGSELKIQDLMVFKWKNQHGKTERFRIISEILNKWQEIGLLVGISHQQLEAWEREKRETKACCIAVLNHWLLNAPREYPVTWEGFCEILEDCELGQVAERLKNAIKSAQFD